MNEQEKSSTERIEEELAKARAAIHKAINNQNYTSNKEEIYIPTGCVYRNAYAFHQLSFEIYKYLLFLVTFNVQSQ